MLSTRQYLHLPIHRHTPAQRESVEEFALSQSAEHLGKRVEARGDPPFALGGVDAPRHPLGLSTEAVAFSAKEGDLSHCVLSGVRRPDCWRCAPTGLSRRGSPGALTTAGPKIAMVRSLPLRYQRLLAGLRQSPQSTLR